MGSSRIEETSRAWEILEDVETLNEYIDNLLNLIASAQKTIRVFAGELHWQVYSDPELHDALRAARRRGVVVQIVTGPVISAWVKGGKNSAPILDLANEGVLELRQRERRGSEQSHFWMMDDELVIEELSHPPQTRLRERTRLQYRKSEKTQAFEKLSTDFGVAWEKSRSVPAGHEGERCEPPLLLTPFQIKDIQKRAEDLGKKYDLLMKDEIEAICDQLEERSELLDRKTQTWLTEFRRS